MHTETLLRACIAERERIGREIHDTIAQDLAGAKVLLQILERRLQPVSAENAEVASKVAECINLALSHLRSITRGLAAVEVPASNLAPALGQLCDEVGRLFTVRCVFQTDEFPSRLSDEGATHLYCLAREALCNAIRHGNADEITVSLQVDGAMGELAVSDNGQGLYESSDHSNGLGLRIMHHRAKQVGGTLNVLQRPEGGTLVKSSFTANSHPPAPN